MSIPTVALFFIEVRGYSKLYDDVGDYKGKVKGHIVREFEFIGYNNCTMMLRTQNVIVKGSPSERERDFN